MKNLATNLVGRTVILDFHTWKPSNDAIEMGVCVPENLRNYFERYYLAKGEIVTAFIKDELPTFGIQLWNGEIHNFTQHVFSVVKETADES